MTLDVSSQHDGSQDETLKVSEKSWKDYLWGKKCKAYVLWHTWIELFYDTVHQPRLNHDLWLKLIFKGSAKVKSLMTAWI
jgi:hypothetical protein